MTDTRSGIPPGFHTLRRRFLWAVGISVVVMAGLTLYGDAPRVAAIVSQFPVVLLPVVFGLASLSYLLRFSKWHFYLRQIGLHDFPLRDSALVFGVGLAMALTPGKVGEGLKSYLLRELTGMPIARSVPVIVAERVTDALALTLLATGGLTVFSFGWQVLAVVLAGVAGLLLILWSPPVAAMGFRLMAQVGPLRSRLHIAATLLESMRSLFRPRVLLAALCLSVVSWGSECLALWVILRGLGLDADNSLLLKVVFIHAVSVLGGAVVSPGGLGVTEGGIIGLGQAVLGLARDVAASGAFLIRLFTLWYAISLGLLALMLVGRRLERVLSPDESLSAPVKLSHRNAENV